jgi:transcriptional regulator with XRE-family HTH domain
MTDASIKKTASRIRIARRSKGLTQAVVASKAEISENHYAQIERGEKNPSTSVLLKIIDALDVASVDILGK